MMETAKIFEYLTRLSAHNEREWFIQHRDEYNDIKLEFDNLLLQVINRLSLFDASVSHLEPSDCTYRIYRDIRFSEDKTPYKIHMGGYINAHGKKSYHCGYYVHLQPGHCMLAGGSLCLPSNLLRAIRQSIYDNIDEFVNIVEDPAFVRYFPSIGDKLLKTAPKGFPRDFPYLRYLQPRNYTCGYMVPDEFFLKDDWLDQTEQVFRQFKRFADFLNETIDNFE